MQNVNKIFRCLRNCSSYGNRTGQEKKQPRILHLHVSEHQSKKKRAESLQDSTTAYKVAFIRLDMFRYGCPTSCQKLIHSITIPLIVAHRHGVASTVLASSPDELPCAKVRLFTKHIFHI